MNKRQRKFTSLLVAFSVLFLISCLSQPQLITSQYVDKPVIIGPYWKVGTKLDNYVNLKKQKGFKEFETEVERMVAATQSQYQSGGYTYTQTNTQQFSIHADTISKDILMQNPTDNELILVKQCFIGAYFMAAPGGAVMTTFGGVEGIIIPKPGKGKSESVAEPKPEKSKKGKTK